jgi:5-methylcytosine-specific restriction endonuclease McrA
MFSVMCERLSDVVSALRVIVAFDPARLRADDAAELVKQFGEAKRLVASGLTRAAGRVSQTGIWRASGAANAATWVSQRTGDSLGSSVETLQTAARLQQAPGVQQAFAAGELSDTQAFEITKAVVADPGAEQELLVLAQQGSVAGLRERCRDVIAAAGGDEDATIRLRRSRSFRVWTDDDGMRCLKARMAPADAAPVEALVAARTAQIAAEAHRAGQHEPREAHAADAVVSLICGDDGSGAEPADALSNDALAASRVRVPRSVKAVVNVVVSASALERGHTVAGEICTIPGVGPISVADATRLGLTGEVKVLQTQAADVTRVAHSGRTIPAKLRSALEYRDHTCVVPECNRRIGLEIDHVIALSEGGLTTLGNLARLCRFHHDQKTHHGWVLSGPAGNRTWRRRPHAERKNRSP